MGSPNLVKYSTVDQDAPPSPYTTTGLYISDYTLAVNGAPVGILYTFRGESVFDLSSTWHLMKDWGNGQIRYRHCYDDGW